MTVAAASDSTMVELDIGGMTCASCAARIEKKLNRIDGVEATVNYAIERATVLMPDGLADVDLLDRVRSMGYTAEVVSPPITTATAAPDRSARDRSGPDRSAPDRTDSGLTDLRQRLIGSAVLGLPVLVVSMIPALQFRNWQWLAFALAGPVVVWGAWPFHRAAALNARHGTSTMDTLVSLGTLSAFGWSVYALFWGGAGEAGMTMDMSLGAGHGDSMAELYLEVACSVTVFLLAGRYFEARAKSASGAALAALLDLGAAEATVLVDGVEHRVPAGDLSVGDRFVVRPGDKIATDGVVEEGSSAVDASLLTGEAVPVDVGPGDAVVGATINTSGRLLVRATRIGADTALAQIAHLVRSAQSGKAPVQRLADRISAVFVPIVLVITTGTFVGWAISGASLTDSFAPAVAVLIIACPCALGLATPTALLVGTGRGAQLGILIKGPEMLESTRRIDAVLVDKTGTITTGEMALVDVVTEAGLDRATALGQVGALEAASEHPLARAIAAAATAELGDLVPVDHFHSTAGLGVSGTVDGVGVIAGRLGFVTGSGLEMPSDLASGLDAAEERGHTAIVAGWDGRVRCLMVLADTVKSTAAAAIAALADLGVAPILVTGDNARAARSVANLVGIDEVIAEVLPVGKVDAVRDLQRQGRVVAMIGDGVNDAAALAQADLGIAVGSGTDVAIEASDLTLVRSDLLGAVDAVRLSRRTLGTIRANLFWAFGYNVAAIPVAAAGLLNPVIAGAAMALSSVFVVSNSLRLRRFAPTAVPTAATRTGEL